MDNHHPNKIPTAVRGIVIVVNIFWSARDLAQNVRAEIMADEDGVPIILERLYKRDTLSITSFIFEKLKSLLSCRRATNEMHVAFEARFTSQTSNYNSMDHISATSVCICDYYLLEDAKVNESQHIAIIGAASPKYAALTPRSSSGSFL